MASIHAVTYIVAGIFEILLPIMLGFYIIRRFGTSWKSWFVGALMFLISLVRLPINSYLSNIIVSGEITYISYILVYLVSSLTAGVFEESARYIGLRYLIKKETYEEGITYGAGHGGIESIFLVGINVLTIGIMLMFNPSSLTDYQLYAVTSSAWYLPLVGAYERLMTIVIHISLSVMVLESLRKKDIKYFLLAVVIHTAIDYLSASAVSYSILYAEMVVTGFAIGLAQWAYGKVKTGLASEPIDETASPES